MIGIIFELSTLNKSPIGRVWSRDMSNTDIVVKLLFIRLNVGDWIDFELDDTHKVTSIRKIDDYLPTISTSTLKVRTSVSFTATDCRLNDDRLQQYNGRVGWSDDLGYVGAVASTAIDVIDNVWVTKIDSKANSCGIEWIISDDADTLIDTDNAMKLRLQIPTTVTSDELFVINSTDVGNVQVRSGLIKSSMIGKTICGRVNRTANNEMGCEWQLEDVISIEKTPVTIDNSLSNISISSSLSTTNKIISDIIGVVTWRTSTNAAVYSAKTGRTMVLGSQLTDQIKVGTWLQFNARSHNYENYKYCVTSYRIIADVLPTRIYQNQFQCCSTVRWNDDGVLICDVLGAVFDRDGLITRSTESCRVWLIKMDQSKNGFSWYVNQRIAIDDTISSSVTSSKLTISQQNTVSDVIGIVVWMAKSFSVVFCAKIDRVMISSHQLTDQIKIGTWIRFDARKVNSNPNCSYVITTYTIISNVLPTQIYQEKLKCCSIVRYNSDGVLISDILGPVCDRRQVLTKSTTPCYVWLIKIDSRKNNHTWGVYKTATDSDIRLLNDNEVSSSNTTTIDDSIIDDDDQLSNEPRPDNITIGLSSVYIIICANFNLDFQPTTTISDDTQSHINKSLSSLKSCLQRVIHNERIRTKIMQVDNELFEDLCNIAFTSNT